MNDNYKLSNISLVAYSDDSAKQENKALSQVSLHAPQFMVFSKSFELPSATVDFDNKDIIGNLGVAARPIIMGGSDPNSPGAPSVKIPINISKGFPSYLMIYLEDFGVDFYDPTKVNSPDNVEFGTDCIIGSHPKIAALTVRVFGQDFPICRQLESVEELEYITAKNCHPKCAFRENMQYDPIVLLRLEDLGLGTENEGYPNVKRLEMEVEIDQIILPRYHGKQFVAAGNTEAKIRAVCALVYENYSLQGTNNNLDFYWK